MCLDVRTSRNKTYSKEELNAFIKTAKKNKTVYKGFSIRKEGDNIRLSGPCTGYEYHLGQKYAFEIDIKGGYWGVSVEKGIHSFRQHKGSMRGMNNNNTYYVIIPCTIPAGAKYVIGKDNEIASNELILPDSFIYQGFEYNINY